MEIERQKRAGAERMMAGQAAERDREQAVDLALLFAGIRRRWVVIATLAAMLASSAFVLATPPRHPGFAQMMLEDQGIISPRPTPRPGRAARPRSTMRPSRARPKRWRQQSDRRAWPRDQSRVRRRLRRPSTASCSRLTVIARPGSRVVQIVSRDPELAARAANAVAEIHLQSRMAAKAAAARPAGAWLAQKIEVLRAKVSDEDAKV